jgi:DNA-binding NarL/FixJ family response regulator
MNELSLFIWGDQGITREGLRAVLCGANLNVIGEGADVAQFLGCAASSHIDAVLVDLPLPICAVNAARQILSVAPSAHVIVLSPYANDPTVGKVAATELRRAGASGLLPKTTPTTELVMAIYRVVTGDAVFPQEPKVLPLGEQPLIDAQRVPLPSLTFRQTQVLKLVAQGFANKEIAHRLSISPKTVEKHRQSVKEKLHTNNAADLARRAISLGLVQAA